MGKPQTLAPNVWYEVEYCGSIIHFLPTCKHPWKRGARSGTVIHYPSTGHPFCTFAIHTFQQDSQFTPVSMECAEDLEEEVVEIARRQVLWG